MRFNTLLGSRRVVAVLAAGTCLQVGTCVRFVGGLNPCLTLLNCDPRQYDFVNSGIDGPGVRPDIDPFCTFPPFCTFAQDPIFGGLAGAP